MLYVKHFEIDIFYFCVLRNCQDMLDFHQNPMILWKVTIHSPGPRDEPLLFPKTASLLLPLPAQEQTLSPSLLAVFVCSSNT